MLTRQEAEKIAREKVREYLDRGSIPKDQVGRLSVALAFKAGELVVKVRRPQVSCCACRFDGQAAGRPDGTILVCRVDMTTGEAVLSK